MIRRGLSQLTIPGGFMGKDQPLHDVSSGTRNALKQSLTRFLTLRRCVLSLLGLILLMTASCGGGDSNGTASVPNTPLTWNNGNWDQVRWQ